MRSLFEALNARDSAALEATTWRCCSRPSDPEDPDGVVARATSAGRTRRPRVARVRAMAARAPRRPAGPSSDGLAGAAFRSGPPRPSVRPFERAAAPRRP